MNAEIIAVGTELLLGQIVNTNAKFLSVELSKVGVNVFYQKVVGAHEQRLLDALSIAFGRCDMVVLTGGLGPTADDLTKETVAKYFGLELVEDKASMDAIYARFARTGGEMAESNKKQAMMPKGCTILKNDNGTAPGAIVEQDGKIAVILPGPPSEMEPMYLTKVYPWLRQRCPDQLYSKVLRVFGVGESSLEERLADLMQNQTDPTIAPYAKEAEVELRITTRAKTEDEAMERINPVAKQIEDTVPGCVYGYGDDTLATALFRVLQRTGKTIATAESCTGGMLGEALTAVPGISAYFGYGVVTYANDVKEDILGVRHATLVAYGAVSEQTAMEMAEGLLKKSGADVAVSVTGIAGPDGGSAEKPVGLVYVGYADSDGVRACKELHLTGDRGRIRRVTVKNALDLVRRKLMEKE